MWGTARGGSAVLAGAVLSLLMAATAHAHAPARFAATWLPKGHRLVTAVADSGASDARPYHRINYRHGPVVWSHRGSSCCGIAMTDGRRITVRGHEARLARYIDEGQSYGRVILWEERPKLWIEIEEVDRDVGDRQLRRVAENVRMVSKARWNHWKRETQRYPSSGAELAKMERQLVATGEARGLEWRLRALVPPGYPWDRNDLRQPCQELSYGGELFTRCDEPAWRRMAGQIFVFGKVPARVRRVRIRDYTDESDPGVIVKSATVDRLPKHAFFAAAMPDDTCAVLIEDADADRDKVVGAASPGEDAPPDQQCERSGTRATPAAR
jgi:hypothetical protein